MNFAENTPERLSILGARCVDVCLPMLDIAAEELNVDFIMPIRCFYKYRVDLTIKDLQMSIAAVTDPATAGDCISNVTLP